MTIKAIETSYKNYKFRSRLEAKWAVFFDAMDLKWEYEPEGFFTNAGPYLPDFRVMTPQGNVMWYEVKPEGVTEDDKFSAFLQEGNFNRGSILSGDPLNVFSYPDIVMCPRCGLIGKPDCGLFINEGIIAKQKLFEVMVGCRPCDDETPCGGDHPWENGVKSHGVTPHKGWVIASYKDEPFSHMRYAAIKAREARFEHGERG